MAFPIHYWIFILESPSFVQTNFLGHPQHTAYLGFSLSFTECSYPPIIEFVKIARPSVPPIIYFSTIKHHFIT
ncbi:hypothetical protein L873DRAFT_1803549 [Choiromyces venosus 120613-1]|uniref:Uncharacterized protein n=1 Tax=Choiromyces venosus 120613-1 TaxID=1336337 RepID=A0A3N4JSS0_9PEZI|nr:hypothetical protein L873DRAFT_1803549 [Choiromyces venosus 120613-1]